MWDIQKKRGGWEDKTKAMQVGEGTGGREVNDAQTIVGNMETSTSDQVDVGFLTKN